MNGNPWHCRSRRNRKGQIVQTVSKDSPVYVPLRKRSTPYDFVVTLTREPSSIRLYGGKSHNYARASYWQAIASAVFLGVSCDVSIAITESRVSVGGFKTKLDAGKMNQLHIPSGRCVEWAGRSFVGGPLAEKMLTIVPGTLGIARSTSMG